MFFVRINDKNFIKAKLITSIKVIETDEKIETVIYNKNGEKIIAFEATLSPSKLRECMTKNILNKIKAFCYREIIAYECNLKDNIFGTFEGWITGYCEEDEVKNIVEDDTAIKSYIDKMISLCDEDLEEYLGE